MERLNKRLEAIETAAGLRNADFFATRYVRKKIPGWKGTDYQAFKIWLDDQKSEHEAGILGISEPVE